MAQETYLAGDFGASSGRLVAGLFDGDRLSIEEVHRFENNATPWADSLHWDVLHLWTELRRGIAKGVARGGRVRSIGVDTWGVDYALLGRNDTLLGNPNSYRDPRTDGVMERLFARVPREEIFRQTGIQFMGINTLYQLVSMVESRSPVLEAAETFLLMPDLFHWLLTGVKGVEYTNATTTQVFDPSKKDWARDLIRKCGLPEKIFGQTLMPGTVLGPLRKKLAAGYGDMQVVLPGTHDTASAVLGVPAATSRGTPDWCYISSGTWSLMGVDIPEPVLTAKALEYNFTNEGGVTGSTRLLKNIGGLWPVQECRRVWASRGKEYSWEELAKQASAEKAWRALVDPDCPSFLNPPDMPEEVNAFCRKTGQAALETPGAVIRALLEGLAFKYRHVLAMLEELTNARYETIHIVGGGAANELLCQLTANACGRRVLAGPIEATAIGNVMMQVIAAKEVAGIDEARGIIRASFPLKEFSPKDTGAWDEAYGRFVDILKR